MLVADSQPREQRRYTSGLTRCLTAVAPLLQAAKERVRFGAQRLRAMYGHSPFDPAAISDSMASSLAPHILAMMARVLVLELNVARLEGVLEGATPEERFDSFVERLADPAVVEQLFQDYPVLREQIDNRLDLWARFQLEFLEHLCDDWPAIQQMFFDKHPGSLVALHGGAGDTHRQGRSVAIGEFSSGARLVYKPRSLAAEEHFQQLLLWLNERGAEPAFQTMRIIDRGAYGWSEFVRPADCADGAQLARFYQRQGGYLAVLYALNACDFHHENLIAAGEHPFLIDTEALFHQRIDDPAANAEPGAPDAFSYSVLHIGLLPRRTGFTRDYEGLDVSGLSSVAGQMTPNVIPLWDRANTDEMRLVRGSVEVPASRNCPRRQGKEASAFDYANSVTDGFCAAYRLLLRNRAEFGAVLDRFAGDDVRVIFRPSQSYGTLLHESFHPDLLQDASERRALFERLREGNTQRPFLSRLIDAELRDLSRGDIPLFLTRPASRDVWTSDGERLTDFFAEPALDMVQRRFANLSEQDLERQLWIVRASLATLSTVPAHTSAGPRAASAKSAAARPAAAEEFLSAACGIGDRLAELALSEGEGCNWIGISMANEKHRYLTPLGPDLYDGLPGVILFLSYLHRLSAQQRYADLAASAITTLRRQARQPGNWTNIGGFAGWSGILYSLTHAAVTLRDEALLAEAEGLLDSMVEGIAADTDFDIIAGSAGCALAVDALRFVKPSPRALAVMRACGERLLETRHDNEHGTGWLSLGSSEMPLTGFAHGGAGIAYALLTVGAQTGDPRFEQAARSALLYERAHFSPQHANWRDLRPGGAFGNAWCHGAPGIALARLCSLRLLDDPPLLEEIRVALSTTEVNGFGRCDILCHGDLGNADILLHASQILNEPRWSAVAHRHAARILNVAGTAGWNCGHPLNVESPGFMCGLAGIGYALLRLADPVRVPCVLALEPPRLS